MIGLKKVFILLFLINYSCKFENVTLREDEINIPLYTRIGNSPVGISYTPFKFLDSIPEKFTGLQSIDSSFIGKISTIKGGDTMVNFKELRNQTGKDVKSYISEIYVLSGYKNGKQFIVLDRNSNYDFSDDEVQIFETGLDFNPFDANGNVNRFPLDTMLVEKMIDNTIYSDTIGIRIQPHPSYFGYNNKPKDEKERMRRELLCSGKFEDYLYGSFVRRDSNYHIAVNKYGWMEPELVINKKSNGFYPFESSEREVYLSKDTLKIADEYFSVENISYHPPSVKLTSLDLNRSEIIGFRKGYTSKNYKVKSLDGKLSFLNDLFEGKELLLVDFWGTWCGPCIELTPQLVALNQRYSDKISMVSLAFQKEIEPVRAYVKDHNMTWYNGIVEGVPKTINPKAEIIKNLRIKVFPTFIILDSKLEIKYRGTGDNFNEITGFLEDYFSR